MTERHACVPEQLSSPDWQADKTLASVAFVHAAVECIMSSTDPIIIGLLADQVNKIKSGEVVLTQALSPEEYILRIQQS